MDIVIALVIIFVICLLPTIIYATITTKAGGEPLLKK